MDQTGSGGSQPAGTSKRVSGEAAEAAGDDWDFSAAGLVLVAKPLVIVGARLVRAHGRGRATPLHDGF
jgi:hypothetical protein